MPQSEEYDWIFDYVLQFLESEKFDSAVMDFIDDRCDEFEDTEENKLIYTEIHKEFCLFVENLIDSNLSEVGITTEIFLESCDKARNARDINTTVFERLLAMDDFQTFKKIMTKRNTLLQMEAIKSFRIINGTKSHLISTDSGKLDDSRDNMYDDLPDPDELRLLKDSNFDWDAFEQLEDEDIQDFLFQSLMEMELIHRQEELEHAELERALNISLTIEEERIRALLAEAKECASDLLSLSLEESTPPADRSDRKQADPSEEKTSQPLNNNNNNLTNREDDKLSKPVDDNSESKSSSSSRRPKETKPVVSSSTVLADLKPLKLRGEMKPLPSISALPAIGKLSDDLEDKKRSAEEAIRRNQEQLQQQRKQEEAIRKQISGIDPEEAERRAKHLSQQRDLLIQKKKQERDVKVRQEEERKAKSRSDSSQVSEAVQKIQTDKDKERDQDSKGREEELAEIRRTTMRLALARRMKSNISDGLKQDEENNYNNNNSFLELEKMEQTMEQLREDNRKRDYILTKQLEKQQAQIARNIRQSAAELSKQNDDI